LHLDLKNLAITSINDTRRRWRENYQKNPDLLFSRIGPQIRCELKGVTTQLVALGAPAPVSFDLNTVQPGVIRLIPGIKQVEIDRWLTEREKEPFTDREDFLRKVSLSPAVSSVLQIH
jgi:hypothetical protein